MSDQVTAALGRIKAALKDKEPANATVQTGEDRDGNPVYGLRTPWAKVLAGDTLLVADAVPKGKRTQVVADLRRGVVDLPAETAVQQQTQCLIELVRVYESGE